MADNSVMFREIDSKQTLDEIAREVRELREFASQKTTRDRLEIERLKKKLNRSLLTLGAFLTVAITLSGMLINYNLRDLKDRQEQLSEQISSLQIESLEHQIANLREQIELLNQQVTPLSDLVPDNYPIESDELNFQNQEEKEKIFQNP